MARKELRGLTETAHLKLIVADNGFYEKEILGRAVPAKSTARKKVNLPSHTRLENALRLAMEHIESIAKQTQQPTQVLLDWIEYRHEKAKVIVVEVNDEGAAYTIFEILNDRGLDLSGSDLLKNFVFRVAGRPKKSGGGGMDLLQKFTDHTKCCDSYRSVTTMCWRRRSSDQIPEIIANFYQL